MSNMEDKDSIQLFSESMKRASSAAKQMAKLTQDKSWLGVADGLNNMRLNAQAMYNAPTPSHSERLRMIDALVEKMGTGQISETVQ